MWLRTKGRGGFGVKLETATLLVFFLVLSVNSQSRSVYNYLIQLFGYPRRFSIVLSMSLTPL